MKKAFNTLAGLFIASMIITAGSHDWALAQQRFVDHGNGTVTDRKLGIMWAKTDNHGDISWNQSQKWLIKDFPETIPQLYNNWRLPTVAELQSLYVDDPKYDGYQTDCGHPVKIVPQIRISCILVWASDTALGRPLAFNFYNGSAFSVDAHENKGCRVLAVRFLKP